ncbi:MAG: glycosyltransferase family 2 protein [Candidatus Rokuibacteriota bacterium]
MSDAGGRSPRVTVVMPVYNAEPYLREALAGVLAQTFTDFELLAIDDGSTDGSLEVLRRCADPRLRVVSRPHEGVVRTMNAALALAQAELIARADADDVCLPERLERQVQFLTAHPGVALVGGVMRSGARLFEYPCDAARMRWLALYQSPVANTTILFRRRAALAVGGYPEDYQLVDDYPFVSRLLGRYDAANLPEPVVLHRPNPEGISGRHPDAQAAEGDRVRRANIAALVPEPVTADALFRLLRGRAAPAARAVAPLLDRLITAFRRCWAPDAARWRGLAPWIGRELFQRALLHGAVAPAVLVRMALYAWWLDGGLVFRPSTPKALLRHVVMPRAGW